MEKLNNINNMKFFLTKSESKLNKLEQQIEIFENFTGVKFENWFAQLEHIMHFKNAELKTKEEILKVKEEMIDKIKEVERAKAKSELEQEYFHSLHKVIEQMNQQNSETMKYIAETLKREDIIINNK